MYPNKLKNHWSFLCSDIVFKCAWDLPPGSLSLESQQLTHNNPATTTPIKQQPEQKIKSKLLWVNWVTWEPEAKVKLKHKNSISGVETHAALRTCPRRPV